LLYPLLVALAEHVITHRLTDEIDRNDRRDLSLFRLGWDFLERRFSLFDPSRPFLGSGTFVYVRWLVSNTQIHIA